MLNQVILQGRMVSDPELRTTQSGISSLSFTLAVGRNFRPKDGGERGADFIRCNAWRRTAENIAKYTSKGTMLLVRGNLQTSAFTNDEGSRRYSTTVNVDDFYFVENKKDGVSPPADGYGVSVGVSAADFQDISEEEAGELPF